MANIDKNFRVKNGLDVKGTINLAAIAESKSETAVDVFVYDTSKDTDGGAWRHRTQHTSWYNEGASSTRGSRKEFPAVAVIVAEASKVTIYDGDDPSLPMWMVFDTLVTRNDHFLTYGSNGGGVSAVSARNGILTVGRSSTTTANQSYNGITIVSFIADAAERIGQYSGTNEGAFSGGISTRNSATLGAATGKLLVENHVNDVAMTVLPDAPTDPATGLPTPTIAVATGGGTSVITDSGAVYDATRWAYTDNVAFTEDGKLITQNDSTGSNGGKYTEVYNLPFTADTSSSGVESYTVWNTTPSLFNSISARNGNWASNGSALGHELGLTHLYRNSSAISTGMVAYTTSSYNTGWMNGDIKGAFLSSTNTADMVGSGELVTNGDDFTGVVNGTSTLPDGASNVGWYETSNGTYSVTGGVITITNGTNGRTGFYWTISVVEGATYRAEWVGQTGGVQTRITDTIDPNDTTPLRIFNLGSTGSKDFVATSSTLYVSVTNYDASSTTGSLDKISVKLADEDRSVNNNSLIVNGTVTRSAVATGADLVSYSGFSSSNYLEQPYNSDLDFGTGDFSVMGWVKTDVSTATFTIFQITDKTGSSYGTKHLVVWGIGSSQQLRLRSSDGANIVNLDTSFTIGSNTWDHVAVKRTGGTYYVYVNGVEVDSVAMASSDFTFGSGYSANIGPYWYNGSFSSSTGGALALIRISATAPTADQIKKIYEDEKFLYQENAQATLYGTSDTVTALDHDEDTDLLHVGTSAGRSVFQGLRRVDNTTDAVGTAISVVDGLVVEE